MKFYKHILALPVLIMSIFLSSCEDNIDYNSQVIGEGEALVEATLEYDPTVTNLGSRSSGEAMKNINELAVVIYNNDGTFFKLYNNSDLQLTHSTTTDVPSDYQGDIAETPTATTTFKITLPYGRYRMYAVANLGRDLTEDEVETIDDLKNIECKWDFAADKVGSNAQMFGYFTNNDDQTSSGFEAAKPVVVNGKDVKLHAWIKRLASKVTVAYDGSGLHQGIYVYVHNVSVRQIPLYCKLGVSNSPQSADSVSTDGFGTAENRTPASALPAQQLLYYDKNGVVDTDDYPNENQYTNWLTVAKGSDVKGAADHTQTDPALFFYENMQGVHPEKPKKPQKDQAGTNVGPADNLPEGYTPEDYKDEVEYGTFIEVEAYYYADYRPVDGTPYVSEGPIKYRFMLGQDVYYNYNAIRNHHYKVTLCFNGYANQPDWHIEYKEESPDIFVPEVYVPYLYNQSVNFPIRFSGNIQSFDMEIIENNWAPYDETNPDGVPEAEVGTDDWTKRETQFAWNRACYMNTGGNAYLRPCPEVARAFTNEQYASNYLYGRHLSDHKKLNGDQVGTEPMYVTPVWVGFLRLCQPDQYTDQKDLPMTLMCDNPGMRYDNASLRGALKTYYEGGGSSTIYQQNNTTGLYDPNLPLGTYTNITPLGKRSFGGESGNPIDVDGTYGGGLNTYDVQTVSSGGKDSKTVTVKLWTQPKTMGYISGFSGNNPYDSYPRKAVIRVTGHFLEQNEDGDGYTNKTIVKDVTVLQSRRLLNPKGVWRLSTDNTSFKFILYQSESAADGNYTPLISRGEWSAKVSAGEGITISGGTSESDGWIHGDTDSQVEFMVNFPGGNHSAIVDVLYHNNSCIHKFYVRQGYDNPEAIVDGGAKWSCYSVYSFDSNTAFAATGTTVNATFTKSPLALGSLFKKGNYSQGIRISNNSTIRPLAIVGQTTQFDLTNGNKATWENISGISRANATSNGVPSVSGNTSCTINEVTYNAATWTWADVKANNGKDYRFPTYDDFDALLKNADIGVGVLYADGATEPATSQKDAYGFFDTSNSLTSSPLGMRGFFAYNSTTGKQVFFPLGTYGIARRTMQGLVAPWRDWAGTLRYSSVTSRLSGYGRDQMRPIPYNMPAVSGVIYWLAQERAVGTESYPGWDMNFFDINFNPYDHAMSIGPGGDAVPIKLIEK
ncbi:MAG: hypothetical protein K2J42_06370 [Muribaculaceae bacterium]|nr:hypothetical protein [Muribaculaceae bacterium]